MLEPLLCGLLAQAPLLPKLRGHFAEFLNNASPAGLRILSSSTCVGLRYGYRQRHSGFSWRGSHVLPYLQFGPLAHRVSLTRPTLLPRVPAVLAGDSAGISTCCPSATPPGLALGPDLPRADQLYPGNLGYSAKRIPTSFSLLIPAFSLPDPPLLLAGTASADQQCSSTKDPPCGVSFLSFGGVFQPRTFSARDLSTSELLRTL